MGSNNNRQISPSKGIDDTGCLSNMYRKNCHECVDGRLMCIWNRWTEGKFPQTGMLSVEKLSECGAMMEIKLRSCLINGNEK